jgi:hypothetical protein
VSAYRRVGEKERDLQGVLLKLKTNENDPIPERITCENSRNLAGLSVAAAGDSRAPEKADGSCKLGAKAARRCAIGPHLPAFARIVRICSLFFGGTRIASISVSAYRRQTQGWPGSLALIGNINGFGNVAVPLTLPSP